MFKLVYSAHVTSADLDLAVARMARSIRQIDAMGNIGFHITPSGRLEVWANSRGAEALGMKAHAPRACRLHRRDTGS